MYRTPTISPRSPRSPPGATPGTVAPASPDAIQYRSLIVDLTLRGSSSGLALTPREQQQPQRRFVALHSPAAPALPSEAGKRHAKVHRSAIRCISPPVCDAGDFLTSSSAEPTYCTTQHSVAQTQSSPPHLKQSISVPTFSHPFSRSSARTVYPRQPRHDPTLAQRRAPSHTCMHFAPTAQKKMNYTLLDSHRRYARWPSDK